MNRMLLMSALLSTGALANEAFFKAEVIDAIAAPKAPTTPGDPAWGKATAKPFRVSAQRTIFLHDRTANAILTQPAKRLIEVKAIVGDDALALRLEWEDAARDVIRDDEVNAFADSVAVETPQVFGPGKRLPAISMGDDDAFVNVTLVRATSSGALESQFAAAGFGSLTRQAPATPNDKSLSWDEAKKKWSAVVRLPRAHAQALTPVAFATWDGARRERSGYKRLSSWHFVRLPGTAPDANYVKDLAWGYAPGDLGDAEQGRALAEQVCIACHRLPGKAFAPPGIAPSLENVGAIATPGYLRDSIVTPSQVIIHEPNPNQHYNPSAERDPNGAAPNSDGFRWSSLGPDGKRVSKMPAFTNFTPQQVGDLVAFLRTLDKPMEAR